MRRIPSWPLALPLVALALIVSASSALAGGATARLLAPARTGGPYVVQAENCGEPARFTVRAVAEGRVRGERRSIVLRLEPGDAPGRWRLARQWPAEGRWVVRLTPDFRGAPTNVTVLGVDGQPGPASYVWKGDGRRESDLALRAD